MTEEPTLWKVCLGVLLGFVAWGLVLYGLNCLGY